MSRKKESSPPLAQDETQIHSLLTHYHEIAQHLHTSQDQAQVESALAPLYALPEGAQIAWLKALSKERTTDAADILASVYAVSTQKEVRKEARRSLLRLEAAKISSDWTPPIAAKPTMQANIDNPPRFWKGLVTQMREEGEVQLTLCWEQGFDYSEARCLIFLLDFWQDGVKDLIVELGSKRHIEEQLATTRQRLGTMLQAECTLAEGRRLLEEALSINEWRGKAPHKDYRNSLPLIKKLILQESELGEDRGTTFIDPALEAQEVVVNFLGAWSLGDYGLAYDLLSKDSSVRAGLGRDEWIALHRRWADDAQPARLELGFIHERAASQSAIWLPPSLSGSTLSAQRKEVEAGWSLEVTTTPLNGILREFPMGTAVNKETGRHWFWTSYTLVREQDGWRIQQSTDEGAKIQSLSIDELQQRIADHEHAADELIRQDDLQRQEILEELSWRLTQILHYYDALLVRLPLDHSIYDDAYGRAVAIGNPERSMVYLERLAQRFSERRAEALRSLGAMQASLAYSYEQAGMQGRYEHFLARAEASLQEALVLDNSAIGHTLLAELLLSKGDHEKAETELVTARSLHPTETEEATIEAGLGNIAMRAEHFEEALPHYQRVIDLNPGYGGIWFNFGFAHRLLGHMAEAEQAYTQAIEHDPQDLRPYTELTALYMNRSARQQARELLEQGIRVNPASAHLHALLASVLFEIGDQREAQRQIQEAEALHPDLEIVQSVRDYIRSKKKK